MCIAIKFSFNDYNSLCSLGFIRNFESKFEEHSRTLFGRNNPFQDIFPTTVKIKHIQFKITKMDATEHGEQITYRDDVSKTILLMIS